MKVLYQSLTKALSYGNVSVDIPKVLLMTPIGVAAVNIDGTTIHTALDILIGSFCKNLTPLGDKMKSSLRNKLSDLKVMIVDEISMVSNDLLFCDHLRLNTIFGSVSNEPLAMITVITVKVFEVFWKHFKIFELTEIMRQLEDSQVFDLLNHARVPDIKGTDIELLKSRVIQPWNDQYPHDALHIFDENATAHQHNLKMLQLIETPLHMIPANDFLPKSILTKMTSYQKDK